ncbi:MAG TPA: PDZ domain-containing protein [Fimbriimonas sp.]|nr:PDZ domain-containing protein [Fimbriimonas sp.]
MLSLAANVLFVLASPQIAQSEVAGWSNIKGSVGILVRGGETRCAAVFISREGYLVANTQSVKKGVTDVMTSSGQRYPVFIEASDNISQLTLLRTASPPKNITPVQVAEVNDGKTSSIFAVVPNAAFKAELTGSEKIGVEQKSNRAYPLQEIRVEQPAITMGGALLFSTRGRFIGTIYASLESASYSDLKQRGAESQLLLNNSQSRNLGPQGLVVAYTPSWEITSKAVAGFLSPSKQAQFGYLGVMVSSAQPSGVEVKSIAKGSGAELGGIRVGDIITNIDGSEIRNQVDFSKALYRLNPGVPATISLIRNGNSLKLSVPVGVQLTWAGGRQEHATGLF